MRRGSLGHRQGGGDAFDHFAEDGLRRGEVEPERPVAAVAESSVHGTAPTIAAVHSGFQSALLVAAGIAGAAGILAAVALPGRRPGTAGAQLATATA